MTEAAVARTTDRTERNRQKAMKRREVAQAVRDVRERLSSSTGTRPAFDYELALGYARNRLSGWLAIALLIATLAIVSGHWFALEHVVGWAAILLLLHSINGVSCRRFAAANLPDAPGAGSTRQFYLGETMFGLAFAVLFLLPSDDPMAPVFKFGALLVMVAIQAMVASNLPKAVMLGTLPMTVLAALMFVIDGGVLNYVLAGFVMVAEAFFITMAQRLHSASLAMLENRVEKDALIAELEHAKAISDDSRRRAEEANLAKSRFLATMSHELRTPLNAILGFSEIIKGEVFGPIGNPNYKEYIADIHGSGEHLLNLINEILDLSRIEAGRYKLSEEAVTLGYVVEECHHLVKLKARNKGITIHEQFETNLPKLWADERAIRQIVLNLLSNAVKFTPAGGEIWIKMGWTAGGGQYVSVRDNGPGIPEEEIPIVLSAFGQGSIAIKSAEQGTGLGLPIVQALIQMHDGHFDLKSRLREGTTVTVTFPSARVMEVMPPIEDERQRRRA